MGTRGTMQPFSGLKLDIPYCVVSRFSADSLAYIMELLQQPRNLTTIYIYIYTKYNDLYPA
jgi:hypothetical protein